MKLLIAILALFSCTSAMACEPELYVEGAERGFRKTGPKCSSVIDDPFFYASVSEAEDLGHGFVSQVIEVNGSCSAEVDYVVLDCSSDRAAIFGGGYSQFELDEDLLQPDGSYLVTDADSYALYGKVKDAAHQGKPLSVDAILASAQTGGIQFSLLTKTWSTVSVGDGKFPLGCGCKLFYPDSAGARN